MKNENEKAKSGKEPLFDSNWMRAEYNRLIEGKTWENSPEVLLDLFEWLIFCKDLAQIDGAKALAKYETVKKQIFKQHGDLYFQMDRLRGLSFIFSYEPISNNNVDWFDHEAKVGRLIRFVEQAEPHDPPFDIYNNKIPDHPGIVFKCGKKEITISRSRLSSVFLRGARNHLKFNLRK